MESFFLKKGSPILYEEDTMSLPHWKNMRESVLKLVNIFKFAKVGIE